MTIKRLPLAAPRALLLALPLAALALGASLAGAQAQVFVRPFYYGGTWSGPVAPPAPEVSGRLPIDVLFEEISDQGYRPLGIISRTRDTVIVEASDPRDRRIRLTVDAYDGEILSRRPIAAARAEPPRSPHIREVPETERATPPRRKSEQAPRPAPANPQGVNPDARKQSPAPASPVAPARDPSQWGKAG